MVTSSVLGTIGMNLGALLLVLFRGWAFRTRIYRPMLLNIGLSVLPVGVLLGGEIGVLALAWAGAPPWVVLATAVLVGLVWLLLLPNAAYLITELNLSHRREDDPVPQWYDILLVLTLAMSGVLNTVLNVVLATVLVVVVRYDDIEPLASGGASWAVAGVLVAVSFGIYLGRYLRLNSWDIVHPGSFLAKVRGHFSTARGIGDAVGFTLLCAVFLGLMYVVIVGPTIHSLVVSLG